jgi:hypothetical protein
MSDIMGKQGSEAVVLVDYENMPRVDARELAPDARLVIVVGKHQAKIPTETVMATQALGDRVEWIRVGGTGANALDFFIAFYLGAYSAAGRHRRLYVLSKDKGYDPLIAHLNASGFVAARVTSVAAARGAAPLVPAAEAPAQSRGRRGRGRDRGARPKARQNASQPPQRMLHRPSRQPAVQVVDAAEAAVRNLSKIAMPRRPKRKDGLVRHLKSLFAGMSEQEVLKVVDSMRQAGFVRTDGKAVEYCR